MISLVGNNLTAGYGGVDIIKNITLEVKQGEIAVIVGPNGAGKSTAMKALLGMLKLTDGTEYEGNFVRGYAEGDVEIRFPSGSLYSGQIKTRLACDMNEMNCSKKSVYQGQGIFTNAKGDQYEGLFLDGQRHGSGILVLDSGIRLEGEWKEDTRWNLMVFDSSGTQLGAYENGVWNSP